MNQMLRAARGVRGVTLVLAVLATTATSDTRGARAGCSPFDDPEVFDPEHYRAVNGDASVGTDAALAREHWCTAGIGAGLEGHPQFSAREYLANHDGVPAGELDLSTECADSAEGTERCAIRHYLRRGGLLAMLRPRRTELTIDDWNALNGAQHSSPVDLSTCTRRGDCCDDVGRCERPCLCAEVAPSFDAPSGQAVQIRILEPRPRQVHEFRAKRARETDDDYFRAIAEAMIPGRELRIPKGVYTLAPGRRRGTSNLHWQINGKHDVILDGQGSTVVFTDTRAGWWMHDSQRVLIRNFAFDVSRPLASLGRVVRGGRSCAIVVDRAHEDRVGPASEARNVSPWDDATGSWTIAPRADVAYPPGTTAYHHDGDRARFRLPYCGRLRGGDRVLVRHFRRGHALAFHGRDNEDVSLVNVTIHGAFHMALVWVGRGLHVDALRVTRRRGRLISASGDGIHVAQGTGDVLVENSVIEHQGDDGLNLETYAFQVTSAVAAPGETRIRTPWRGHGGWRSGDRLGVFNPAMGLVETATVTGATAKGHRHWDLRLRPPLAIAPSTLSRGGYTLRNLTRNNARYLLRNNAFRDNRGRGLILNAPLGAVVGNAFRRQQMVAVQVASDTAYWQTGAGVHDLAIRNNLIEHSGWALGIRPTVHDLGAVSIFTELPVASRTPSAYPVHRYIEISGNIFRRTRGPAVSVMSAVDVEITDNLLEDTNLDARVKAYGSTSSRASMLLHKAFRVRMSGNVGTGSAWPIGWDVRTTSGISCRDPAGSRLCP